MIGWGFKIGQETLVLTTFYTRVAKHTFKCGGMNFRQGTTYRQYVLPRGEFRKYMEDNGLRYFQAGDLKIPVEQVKLSAVLSVRD